MNAIYVLVLLAVLISLLICLITLRQPAVSHVMPCQRQPMC